MPSGAIILIAALLGMLVGVWATYAFLATERARRREVISPAASESSISPIPC